MHPFDPKALLLARHAQHVVLIHFPIALYFAGVFFDALSLFKKRDALATAAYYNLALAAFFTVPVIATGLLAWQFALEGQRLKGILLLHLLLASASSLFIVLTWWIHRRGQRSEDGLLPGYRWPVQAVAILLVTLTGHLGGFLSGVNS
jgi:uncharacterized membrane protein